VHSLLTGMMILVFAFHSLFGCCWHHAHQYALCSELLSPTAESPGFTQNIADNNHNEPIHHHYGAERCMGVVCVFIKPSQSVAQTSTNFHLPTVKFIMPESDSFCDQTKDLLVCDHSPLLSLRLHLVNQVLLI